jgi:hypothetical protein
VEVHQFCQLPAVRTLQVSFPRQTQSFLSPSPN